MIERRPDESEFEYHKRLVYGKLVDKTLADYDFTELSKFAYGKEYAADVARRMMYGSKYTLDLFDQDRESGVEDTDLAGELRRERKELEKERQRFFDQRREYKKIVSSDSRWEYLTQALSNSADRLREEIGLLYDGENVESEFGDSEAVLVFSDWHFGMTASNVFNQYNKQICIERVHAVVERAIQRIRFHRCRRLHVVVLGDLIHGSIHVSARVASEELVCDQLMQASEILAQSIAELSRYVDEVKVYMTYGNHGRTIQNKADSIHRDNIERIIPWWLEQRFQNRGDIEIVRDDGTEFQYINACGHWLLAVHGDLDNIHSAPRLFGNIAHRAHGREIETVLLGDRHHRASDSELGIDALLCGSLCGTDDYANDHRLYASPSQLLLIVTPDDGVDAEYRISADCRRL